MINIKPLIYTELKKVTSNVNDTYPSDWATFPVVQYVEEDNRTHTKCNEQERLAYVRYKIDIWNDESTSEATIAVDNVISKLGLNRTFCSDVPDTSTLKHKVIRYEGIIDITNLRVYN